jgi:hypothetical protein
LGSRRLPLRQTRLKPDWSKAMSRNAGNMRWIDALMVELARRLGAAAELLVAPFRAKRNALHRPVYVDATRSRRKRISAGYWR